MSTFKQVIADASYIDSFEIELPTMDVKQSIITLYDVRKDTKLLFERLGIDILSSRILDNQTVYLDENQVEVLLKKHPILFQWQPLICQVYHPMILSMSIKQKW